MKMNIIRKVGLSSLVIGVAVGLVTASPAKANLQITVTDSFATTHTFVAGAGLNSLNITGAQLQAFFGYLDSTSVLSASSDQGTGDPFRQITESSTFKIGTGPFISGPPVTLNVVATQDGFIIPPGNPKFLSSTASVSFGLTSAGDVGSYQGFGDPSNALGGTAVANSLIGPFIDPDNNNNSFAGNSPAVAFNASTYSLTIHTSSTLNSVSDQVQVQGTTSVLSTGPPSTAPEPATILTAGLGGVFGLFMLRRKSKLAV